VSDRIGLHVGEVVIEEQAGRAKQRDLYGIQVDTCARVMSLAGANQILMTRFAFDSAPGAQGTGAV
jgi:class 3 adenylate cyclase